MRKLVMIVVIAIVGITNVSAQDVHKLIAVRLFGNAVYDLVGTVTYFEDVIVVNYPNHIAVITLADKIEDYYKIQPDTDSSKYFEFNSRIVYIRLSDDGVIVTNERCNIAVHNESTTQILLRGGSHGIEDDVEFLFNASLIDQLAIRAQVTQ